MNRIFSVIAFILIILLLIFSLSGYLNSGTTRLVEKKALMTVQWHFAGDPNPLARLLQVDSIHLVEQSSGYYTGQVYTTYQGVPHIMTITVSEPSDGNTSFIIQPDQFSFIPGY